VNTTVALNKLETAAARLADAETRREAAVAVAMDAGCTWAEIGAALGVSSQAAHRRFRWLRHSPLTGETWHEPPLPV
jgi:DNA-binding NarL/FixJ family response regulator